MNDAAFNAAARAGLTPCPFCGGEPSLYIEPFAVAKCLRCNVGIDGRSHVDPVGDAVRRWNTRAAVRYEAPLVTLTGTVHDLKTQDPHFEQVKSGAKRFELRFDDRGGFAVGDVLRLRQWDADRFYSGESVDVVVTHVLRDAVCIPGALGEGWALMSIAPAWPGLGCG